MNIVFMGAKQGGMIGLLTVASYFQKLGDDHEIDVIPHDNIVRSIAEMHPAIGDVVDSINKIDISGNLYLCPELIISVHGREIVSNEILSKFKYGGINLHPMLSKYKGANPISRFIGDSLHDKTDNMASVGVHRMTDILDGGEVLSEKFIEIDSPWERSSAEIYNELYPLYPLVLMEAIQKVCG